MIIGLTGTCGAGKDTVAEYLEKKKGYIHFSLSDVLRKELEKSGIPAVRENLIRVGSELRASEGHAVLAKRALEGFLPGRNFVITSIRHPAEIEELRKHGDFFMVTVDAPAQLRFDRIRKRQRKGDPETLERLLELEKLESQSSGSGQQLGECMKQADHILVNDAQTLEGLSEKIESMLTAFVRKAGASAPAKKLMIVDDDKDVNCILKTVLEQAGFNVVSYFNAESALASIKEEKPDLVMLDVMMPGISGYQACERIKNDPETSAIPVIMLTARDMGEDVEMAMKYKADWFIAKPFDNDYLIKKITKFVTKKG